MSQPINLLEQRTALRIIAQETVSTCEVREAAHHVTIIVKTRADVDKIMQVVRAEGWHNINCINGSYTSMYYIHIMLNRS